MLLAWTPPWSGGIQRRCSTPPTIREKAPAPTPPNTTTPAQPTHVEDQPFASSDKAPTTSTVAKKTPSSDKVLSSVEATISGPQPFAEE